MTTASPGCSDLPLPGQRLLQIRDSDFVRVRQHRETFRGGDVDQDASRHERPDGMDAKLREAASRRRFIDRYAVVHLAPDRLVREAVELRAHLADLADDHLFVAAAPVRLRVHERALRMHVESPRSEKRHRPRQLVPELVDLTCPDQARSPKYGLGLHVICRATLVPGAPFRRTPRLLVRRLPRLRIGRGTSGATGEDDEKNANRAGNSHALDTCSIVLVQCSYLEPFRSGQEVAL